MSKKILHLVIVFLFTVNCFAEVAVELKGTDHIRGGGRAQAEQIYKVVIQNKPGSDEALKTQGKVTALYIITGKITQAEAEIDKMINDY